MAGSAPPQTSAGNEDPRVAELFAKASKLHADGDRAAAEASYREVLRLSPKHADAQHMLGALLIQLHGDKKFDEARALVQSAINARPSCAKFRQSMGVLLQTCGRHQEAVDAFEFANEKDPMNVQTLMLLGRALREVGRNMRAAEVFRSITMLEPDHPKAHYQRATCLRVVGKTEEALASLRQHQRLFPADEQTRFWISAMSGDVEAMQAMPASLVAGLFDQYADKFDEHLVNQLNYRTPAMLMDAILHACSTSDASGGVGAVGALCWQRAVDLGCGTGLMGPLLRPHVSGCLEGVDLSAGMVEKARSRGCYDRLAVDELVAHIEQRGGDQAEANTCPPYDLLVAADVFVYIGNLQPVMKAAADHSKEGAVFGFSTEALEERTHANDGQTSINPTHRHGQPESASYAITSSGRYAHSQGYLHEVAKACGWQVLYLSTAVIRHNAGKPVQGHLCVLKRD